MRKLFPALFFLLFAGLAPIAGQVLFANCPVPVGPPTINSISLTGSNCAQNQCGFTASSSGTVGTAAAAISTGIGFSGTYALTTAGTDSNGVPCIGYPTISINSSSGVISYAANSPATWYRGLCVTASQSGLASFTKAFTVYGGQWMSPTGTSQTTCSFSTPCDTFAHCQTSIDALPGSARTCFLRGGSYSMGALYTFNNNEYFSSYPADTSAPSVSTSSQSGSGAAFWCNGCKNVAIYGLTFTSSPNQAAAGTNGLILVNNAADGVYIDNNTFTFATTAFQYLVVFDSGALNGIYFRGNTMTQAVTGTAPNPGNTCSPTNQLCNNVSVTEDDGANYSNVFILNNTFNGCVVACVEWGNGGSGNTGYYQNVHIDYNSFSNFQGLNSVCNQVTFAALSLVPHGTNTQSIGPGGATVSNNSFTLPSNTNTCSWALESGWNNTTYQYNTFTGGIHIGFNNTDAAAAGQATGSEALNNTFNIGGGQTQSGACTTNATCTFGWASAADANWYIGTNTTIDGGGTHTPTGCAGTGTPYYCTSGTYSNPSAPSLFSAAQPYKGEFP